MIEYNLTFNRSNFHFCNKSFKFLFILSCLLTSLGNTPNVLSIYFSQGHANSHLIDYLTEKFVQSPDKLMNSSATVVYTYICGLTQTEYRPQYIEFIKDSIMETECFKTCGRDEVIWPKLLISLSALGIYKKDVFERAKELQIIERIVKASKFLDVRKWYLIGIL